MSFEVGRLSAALTLDGVDQFHRDIDGAGRKLQETGQRGASFGRAAEAAVRTAAGATTGLVTAAGAYLAILTKTGVAYNSLQQNSRAALSVLLGGAEQANAQMDKLDAFAKNSPFSKSVFIQAQQQLIGFGMQAGKVIPTLDAIQQGVAAMGGSNEQISEVVNILAKVQSTGKFTAETLNELGYRGIDAATLMGNAMGKTAAQIREDVSDAAIGGSEAIDILVDAMQNRFGGAADGVKQQWSGAVDRIKAAQRDLGANIAEPFVSAQGGGMAVTWGNQVADVLRAIEKQAVPVMGILTQRGMPFFAALTQGLDSAQASIQRWNPASLEVSLDRLANHAPGIAATAGAVLALGANVGPLGQMLSVLGISANPAVAAFVGLAAASPEVRAALGDLLAAGKPLLPLLGELAVIMSGTLNSALPLVSDGVEVLTALLRPAIGLLDAIPTPVLAGALAFLAMHKALGPLTPAIQMAGRSLQSIQEQMRLQQHLASMSTSSMTQLGVATVDVARTGGRELGTFGAAAATASAQVTGLGNALKTAFLANPIGIALTVVATAVGAWAMANAAAQRKVEEHNAAVTALKDTLNQTTGATTEATLSQIEQNLANSDAVSQMEKLGISHAEAAAAILDGGAAYDELTQKVKDNSQEAHRGSEAYAQAREGFTLTAGEGMTLLEVLEDQVAAQEAAKQAVQDKIQADRDAAAAMSEAGRSNERFNEALQVARDITQDAETRVRALKQALDELTGGQLSAEEAAKQLSEANLTLAEGLSQTDQAGTKLWQSTLDGVGTIDIGTRQGLAFADAMGQSRDAMLDAAIAAADQALAQGDVVGAVEAATAAGNGYIDTLRQTMADAGLTQEQIDGLIGKYLDVPSVVATLLTDEGTISEVDQRALALALQLEGIPEGKSITVDDPGSPAVIQRLRDVGLKVEAIPGTKQIQITQSGADAVESILNNLVRHRVAEVGVRYTGGGGTMTKADGGVVGHAGGRSVDMRSFANGGGFPTGIFAGGPPLIKFAEPETGWEAFISGRKGQEARNAKIAMDALARLGFPVVPVSALRGIPAFANGGAVNHSSAVSGRPPVGTVPVQRRERRRGRRGMLADTIHIGEKATSNDYRNAASILGRLMDEFERER
ncbi:MULTISPECIES: tape measure protein [unclassified Leucobacter]|uniref:tape measure protein n=1 Tax=unclassified Leucobacter TaxID=2621730 RepID=UPI003018D117